MEKSFYEIIYKRLRKKYIFLDNCMFEMPRGWLFAFGEDMMRDIQTALNNEKKRTGIDPLKSEYPWYIVQIKEKFGELRVYSSHIIDEIEDEVIPKYKKLADHTCVWCGDKATKLSYGWIEPWCDQHFAEYCDENAQYSEIKSEEDT